MSPVGAFQIVENAIVELMGNLHIDGVTCIRDYNAMWIFARNRIEFKHKLHWMDEYILECYISSIENAKLTLDTIVKHNETTILVARTLLCALDVSTGRIRRCDSVGVKADMQTETPEIKIKFTDTNFVPTVLVDSVTSCSTDIDYCNHTNNISYIRYILNQYKGSQIQQQPITAIEIQYINQSFEGDKLEIYRYLSDKFSIKSNNKSVANCIIEFNCEKSNN